MTIVTTPPQLPDLLGAAPADLVDRDADAPVATADEARQRADRIRAGLPSYVQMRQDIADAFARRDWQALGHASWFEYLAIEYGDLLKQLAHDRDQRRQMVHDLRAQGMSTRQIGERAGVSDMQVRRDLQVRPDVAPGESKPEPGRVTGSDGKSYPASKAIKPSADRVDPVADTPCGGCGKPMPADEVAEGFLRCNTCDPNGAHYEDKPAERVSRSDRPVVADPGKAAGAAAGQDPRPAAVPDQPKPAKWAPGEREAHDAEVLRQQDIRSAHRAAENIVTEFRTLVVTVVTGVRLGETGLVTAEMIADLRKTLELLEGEL